MTDQQAERLLTALHDANTSLSTIAACLECVTDTNKRTIRMEDVERARVYSEHMGGKLRKSSKGRCK